MPKKTGFTLIEILIAVSIIGVLSGVVISIINPARSRYKAEDGVRFSTIEKLAQGINAYRHASLEDKFPAVVEGKPIGLGTDNSGIGPYIKTWPNGTPQNSVYVYAVNEVTNPTEFAVCSTSSSSTSTNPLVIVYSSLRDTVEECKSTSENCKNLIETCTP